MSLGFFRPATSLAAYGSYVRINTDGSITVAAGPTPTGGFAPTQLGVVNIATAGLKFYDYLGTTAILQLTTGAVTVLATSFTAPASVVGNLAVNANLVQGASVSIRTSGTQTGSGAADLHLGATLNAGQNTSTLRGIRVTTSMTPLAFTGTTGFGIDLRPSFVASGTWTNQYGININANFTASPTNYGIFVDVVDHGSVNGYGIAITRPAGTGPIALGLLGAITAGGNLASAMQIGPPTTGPLVLAGSGAPTVSAPQGSLYLQTDGSLPSTATDSVGTWVSVGAAATSITRAGGTVQVTAAGLVTTTIANQAAVVAEAIGSDFLGPTWTITGNYATQRFTVFEIPTFTSAGAQTISDVATVAIAGIPLAQGAAVGTRKMALWVQAGPIVTATGSNAAPTYSFTSNLNTGIYSPSANLVNVTCGGNVSASFTGAAEILGQWGAAATWLLTSVDAGAGNSNRAGFPLIIQAGAGTGAGAASYIAFQAAGTGAGAAVLNTYTEVMRLNGNGGVGIGITADPGLGNLALLGKGTRYNNVATKGWGVPAIYGENRPGTQTNTTTTLEAYTVGAADGSFLVSANINVTASATVTMTVTVVYTDEANVVRTITLPFLLAAGTFVTSITTAQGNIAYESPVIEIRAKATTTITIATAGTVTGVTYTGEGHISQIA